MPIRIDGGTLHVCRGLAAGTLMALSSSIVMAQPTTPVSVAGWSQGTVQAVDIWVSAEREASAASAVRERRNRAWKQAMDTAFTRTGVQSCFRGQMDGLVSGALDDRSGLSGSGRARAEMSSVELVLSTVTPQGVKIGHSFGTGTVVRNMNGGPDRILTAQHVASSVFSSPHRAADEAVHARTGARDLIEVWSVSAGGPTLLGTASVVASGGGTYVSGWVERRGRALDLMQVPGGNDWAVLSFKARDARAQATYEGLGVRLSSDQAPHPFLMSSGVPYMADVSSAALPDARTMPGGVPTAGMGTGHSGGGLMMADARGEPVLSGIVSGVLPGGEEMAVDMQQGAPLAGRVSRDVSVVRRTTYAVAQHVPEEAIRVLGAEGFAFPTANASVLMGATVFTAGYRDGHCAVSAAFTQDMPQTPSVVHMGVHARTLKVGEHLPHAGNLWLRGADGSITGVVRPGQPAEFYDHPVRRPDASRAWEDEEARVRKFRTGAERRTFGVSPDPAGRDGTPADAVLQAGARSPYGR